MTIDENDPRLTAYVLGELDGDDLDAFERLLAEDPDARAFVETRRETTERLAAGLPALAGAGEVLGDLPRARVVAAAGPHPAPWWRRPVVPARVAAAAILVAGLLGGGYLLRGGTPDEPRVQCELPPEARPTGRPPVVRGTPSVAWGDAVDASEAREVTEGTDTPVAPSGPAPVPEPAIKDAEISDHVETDHDLEYEETLGEDGFSGKPFSGPATNGLIGVGGGTGAGRFRRSGPAQPGGGAGGRLGGQGESGETGGPAEGGVHGARPPFHTEGYDRLQDNPFFRTADRDTSTFSTDVDTASYANVRRYLQQLGRLPPKDAVRIEELINYFPYDYEPPEEDAKHPFAYRTVVAACPWEPTHRLVRVAIQGRVMDAETRPPANLVFLLDVSGSMNRPNKLPLVQQSMRLLVERLRPDDRVAIVVYAGAAGLVLPATGGGERATIQAAIDRLRAGGSTNGGAGIELAYQIATANRIDGGANRVILCTDGDFNVGVSDRGSLSRLIEEKAKGGVFLTVLGFGMGNLKDGRMEELSNKGNGNYGYVDNLKEAKKLLVDEGLGTLVTIAKDVKIQIHFNPRDVGAWRLIGYENRLLRKQDFNDDTKDAGEIGAGHAVTALYEIVPTGLRAAVQPKVDPNPFLTSPGLPVEGAPKGLLRLRLRYKLPEGDTSALLETFVEDAGLAFENADTDFQWAAAVAGFGMLLRDSPHKGQCSWPLALEIAQAARGEDQAGYRAECVQLMGLAATLAAR